MTTMADPRQALRQKLAEVLGERHAETLMRALPTPEGIDLATRSDMDALGARIDGLVTRVDALESRMERIETRLDMVFEALRTQSESFGSELRAQTRTFVLSQVGAMAAMGAVFTAALAIT